MSKYFKATVANGERFYEDSNHNYVAKMLDGEGFTARIDSTDRTYFITTRIDESAEVVIMEISPSIHCPKEAFSQVGEYINKINTKYKTCNIRIAENGNLHIHAEQRFEDAPVSVDVFEALEGECIIILDTFAGVLEKLAHMKLIEPDEADVEKMIENRRKKIKMKIAQSLAERDFDNDKVSGSTRGPIGAPPGFAEWLRKKGEEGDLLARLCLARREDESQTENKETSGSGSGSLLRDIMNIMEEDDEDEFSVEDEDETPTGSSFGEVIKNADEADETESFIDPEQKTTIASLFSRIMSGLADDDKSEFCELIDADEDESDGDEAEIISIDAEEENASN